MEIRLDSNKNDFEGSAIVLSPKACNDTTGFVSVCPITHTVRGWGYEVSLPDGLVFNGVILTDQIKNLDCELEVWRSSGKATGEVVNECLTKYTHFCSESHPWGWLFYYS
jgi:mRNA interferase MazF